MRPQPFWFFTIMGGAGLVRALAHHPVEVLDWVALASSIVMCGFAVVLFIFSRRGKPTRWS